MSARKAAKVRTKGRAQASERELEALAGIAALRARMDRHNARIAAAIQERARLARAIGSAKAKRGLPAADPRREREMLERVLAGAPPGFSRAELRRLFRALFEASRALVVRDARRRAKRQRSRAKRR